MGKLTPSNEEIVLLQRMFEEKVEMIGVEGLYYEVKDHNLSKLASLDEVIHYETPVKIDFLFEEMPNPKTLRNLHWWDDNDETTPPIAYLPWHIDKERTYLLKPSIGSKLEIKDPLSDFVRAFEIQEVNANSLYLVYSIVKLTPLRENKKPKSEPAIIKGVKGTQYEFLKD